MSESLDSFDDLHAPEVVKPLTPKADTPHRGKDTATPDTDGPPRSSPEMKRDAQRMATVSPTTPNGTAPSHPEARVTPPPLPDNSGTPRQSPPRPLAEHQQQKTRSGKQTWVAVPIVAGVLLIVWYYASSHTPQPAVPSPPSMPAADSRAPAGRGDGPGTPRDSQAMPEERGAKAKPAIAETPEPVAAIRPVGKIRLTAFAIDTAGQRHAVAGEAQFTLQHAQTDFAISTNVAIPCLWRNIPAGEHHASLSVTGYRPAGTASVTVQADITNDVSIALQPLSARVTFVFPNNSTIFSVHNDSGLLGTSYTAYDLTPFVPHYLTFKAEGWRDKRVKVHLEKPGTSYRCSIQMERSEATPSAAVAVQQSLDATAAKRSSGSSLLSGTRGHDVLLTHPAPSPVAAARVISTQPTPRSDLSSATSWEDEQRQDEAIRIQQLTGVSVDWRKYSFSALYDKRQAIEEVQRIEQITGERLDWQQLSFSRAYDMRQAAEEIAQLNRITGAAVDWHSYSFSKAYDMRQAAEEISRLNELTGARLDWRKFSFSQAYDMRQAAETIAEINQQTGRNYRWQDFTFSKAYDLKMKLGL